MSRATGVIVFTLFPRPGLVVLAALRLLVIVHWLRLSTGAGCHPADGTEQTAPTSLAEHPDSGCDVVRWGHTERDNWQPFEEWRAART
jgi:hypothetical protein